jgi:Dihydroorotase and related cyclic amidohydrolases
MADFCVRIGDMSNILIQNGLLVDTEWQRHADLYIEGGKIKRIAPHIDIKTLPPDTAELNADGKIVMPGCIDAHTHYHLVSRGTVTADSFREGSRCAAYGGVTTVIDFADDDKESLLGSAKNRIMEMQHAMAVDFSIHEGVYAWRDTIPHEMAELKKRGVNAIKLFTTYKNCGYLVEKRDELKAIFKAAKDNKLLVCVHCEDDKTITDIDKNWKGGHNPIDHAALRPAEAEAKAIEYVGGIAKELDMYLYIVHLSSKAGLEAVRKLRGEGAKLIVETTPHYLFLNKESLEGENGPLYVMTPPLREEEDNLALQEALCNGEIQVVATDHCAFTKEQKLESDDCRTILPGIPGTEEMLPLIATLMTNSSLSMQQVVNLCSTGPAKAFGLYPMKGSLKEGSDADIVIFDPDQAWTLSRDSLHSASGYTCYEGWSVIGKVVMTYLRGRLVMGADMYLGIPGDGRFVKGHKAEL